MIFSKARVKMEKNKINKEEKFPHFYDGKPCELCGKGHLRAKGSYSYNCDYCGISVNITPAFTVD